MMDAMSDASPSAKSRAFDQGMMQTMAKQMHEGDWSQIARAIDLFRARRQKPADGEQG
ncbi:MAG TPA: hypothetical protein VHO06_26700 [Polyangia bacterium]|nr:hypothetical protein [Polyangia bacterium]